MSIVYQNDFESQADNWSSPDLIVRDNSWGFVSPSNSLRFSPEATLTQNLGHVDTIQFQYNCSMGGNTLSYFDASAIEHSISLPGGATCDTSTWNDTGLLTVNDDVTALKLVSIISGQTAIDDITINGSDAAPGGFTPTQGAAVVTGIGSSLADVMLPVLPIVFGFVLVSFVVVWAFNRLVAFFRRS